MAENDPNPNEPDPNAPAVDADETEAAALAVDMGGNRMVPLSALIQAKKDGKVARDRVKELEPIAASATEIGTRLSQAQPIINAILNNPKLRAEALRGAGQGDGTRVSGDSTDQSDDPDLVAYAEDAGYYLSDGVTPDTARAQRQMTRILNQSGKQTDARLAPLAGVTLNSAADRNIQAAISATDEDGTPWATRESIDEVLKLIPKQMLADPQVSNIILTQAIGFDRMKKRSPKPPEEPLFMERQGGGRTREMPLSSQEKDFMAKAGITEKEYRSAGAQLATGRAIEFGGK